MTRPAEHLKAVQVEGVLVRLALQRRDVIDFQTTGLAAFAAPKVVALEYGSAYGLPAAAVDIMVIAAQVDFWRGQVAVMIT